MCKIASSPPRTPLGELTVLPQAPYLMGRGLAAPPAKNPTHTLSPSGLVSTGLRVQPITEWAILLMIDFKCRPI